MTTAHAERVVTSIVPGREWTLTRRDHPIHARLTYRASDPYAVHVHLNTGARWAFAREWLPAALNGTHPPFYTRMSPAQRHALFDVTVHRAVTTPELLVFDLTRGVHTMVELEVTPVESWLARTYLVVRRGYEDRHLAEHVDWDAEARDLTA